MVSIDHSSFANNGLLGGAEGSLAPVYQGYQTDRTPPLLQLYRAFWPMISMVINDALTATNLDTSTTLGLVTLNADGSFTLIPTGQFDYLAAGSALIFAHTPIDGKVIPNVATR